MIATRKKNQKNVKGRKITAQQGIKLDLKSCTQLVLVLGGRRLWGPSEEATHRKDP